MGGSKKQTVGYKYYLGIHMILCHGPVDKITRIRVDERDAWVGERGPGRININKPGLFGGESREGGVQGPLDFETGGPAQGPNDYLQGQLGGLVPAFRGVAGVVLRQMYLGMNPYLKRWDFRLTRVHLRQNGVAQWYYPKAEIKVTSTFKVPQMFYFAVDLSGSMDTVVTGSSLTRLQITKNQLSSVLDAIDNLRIDSNQPVDICIVGWSSSAPSITRRNVNTAAVGELKTWLNALTIGGGTEFEQAFAHTTTFFQPGSAGEKGRKMFFITDGEPFPLSSAATAVSMYGDMINKTGVWSTTPVDIHGVNIDLQDTSYTTMIDNTPQDGVPIVDSADSTALFDAVFFATMGDASSLNAAHVIRECLTDPDWGMGYNDADIDDLSFVKAADVLYRERLGISVLWDRQKSIEGFIQDIVKHIDAVLYVDRKTGRFALKLIRGGYDKATLLHLDENTIDSMSNFTRPAFGELANSVTVQYWNVITGKDASVTAQDIALQQMQGVTIGTTVQYPGIVDPIIAERLAQRDLVTLSTQRASCTIIAHRVAKNLSIGDVFRLSWADYNIADVVFRITGIAYGDGKNTRVKITCTEDTFDMPETSFVVPAPPPTDPTRVPPIPLEREDAFELPYIELVQQLGQTEVDNRLARLPEMGFLGVAAGSPTSASINARIFTAPSGGAYSEAGVVDFCPTALLTTTLTKAQTVLAIGNGVDMDQLVLPSFAQVNDELIWVESYDDVAGTITVRRALYDTLPQPHPAGAVIFFWDNYGAGSSTEYVEGEMVDTKLLTVNGQGSLELAAATALPVTFARRAVRPYRPANARLDGLLEWDSAEPIEYPIVFTWAGRNRIQETGGVPLGWTDPAVMQEAGATYRLTIDALDGDAATVIGTVVINGVTAETYTLQVADLGANSGAPFVRFTIHSVRDGHESLTAPSFLFRGPFQRPTELVGEYRSRRAVKDLNFAITNP